MAKSKIEWTEHTWNPTTGCDRISPGCDNCYALIRAARLKAIELGKPPKYPKYQTDGDPRTSGPGFGVAVHPHTLDIPRKRRKPTVYFVNSMSDLFHARVPTPFIRQVFDVMAETPHHTYLILTKRSHRLARLADNLIWPANVWMGVSIENADVLYRADHLRSVPAAVRWISAEPLLGSLAGLDLDGIGWVVAGGESGRGHRPPAESWLTELRDACTASNIPFFFKQWGGRTPTAGGRMLEGREWNDRPALH